MARTKSNRSRGRRKLLPIYSIIVDGDTEIWHLQLLKELEGLKQIRIKPELPKKKSLDEQYEFVLERFDDFDKVIWIVDMDVLIQDGRKKNDFKNYVIRFQKMKATIEKKGGIVIVNTPCLEEWFILHFEYTTKYFPDCKSAEERLKNHLEDYEKTEKYYKKYNDDLYKKLRERLPDALVNSRKLGEVNFDKIEAAKCEMYKLFDFLSIE